MRKYWVYILVSQNNGTLYIGVTNNLIRRIYEHKNKLIPGFTTKYGVDRLVYTAEFETINLAIAYEKRLKRWDRAWKIRLIEEHNPEWTDLYEQIMSIGITS